MILFTSDYSEGCLDAILRRLEKTNYVQTPGYSTDEYCEHARELIRKECDAPNSDVHFFVGGTQTNLIMIAAALRPHQGVLGCATAHVNVHETGAIEATGHKVMTVPSEDGKIRPEQIREVVRLHREDKGYFHCVMPKMVYISQPTEMGTLYSLAELEELSALCKELDLILYCDGARLGYGLVCKENDTTMADLARLTDAFYIGGTKVGALFGEALVINNPEIGKDFRYIIKQRGGLLAKGRLLGLQFETMFTDGLYWDASRHAIEMADQLREQISKLGYKFFVDSPTNQIFAIFPDTILAEISKKYEYTYHCQVDEKNSAIRLCTNWATLQQSVDEFCYDLAELTAQQQQ